MGIDFNRLPIRQSSLIILPLATFLLASTLTAQAQNDPGRQRRREVIDDLLKTLIDSQVAPGQAATATPQVDALRNPKVRQAVTLLNQAALDAQRLVTQLQGDLYRSPGVRPLLGDALNISASLTTAARNLSLTEDVEANREALRAIDRDWRLLSYRLRQLTGLSAETLRTIEKGDQFERGLTELLQVTPELDRWELVRQTAALVNELENLVEDIRLEVSDRGTRDRLVEQAGNVLRQAQRVTFVAGRTTSYDEIRTEYQQFQESWNRLSNQLRGQTSRVLERQTRRIQATDRTLHELLWLPRRVDNTQISHLATLLKSDMDRLIDAVTLRMLASSTVDRDKLINSAAKFYGSCRDFIQLAGSGEDQATLANIYYYLQDNWQDLQNASNPLRYGAPGQALADIESTMVELRELLGAGQRYDRTRALETVSSLATNASQLQLELQRIFAQPNRYPRDFQVETLRASNDFRTAIQQLYDSLNRNDSSSDFRTRSDDVVRRWTTLNKSAGQLGGTDQNRLTTLRRQLTQLIVTLQTALTL